MGEKKRSLQKQRVQTVQSRDRIQPESHERKRPENRGGKHTESCNRKQLEIRDRMSNGKFQGKPESNVKRKLSEKPRTMTIERETISQRDYGLPRDHGGARLRAHFPPKRRHNHTTMTSTTKTWIHLLTTARRRQKPFLVISRTFLDTIEISKWKSFCIDKLVVKACLTVPVYNCSNIRKVE